MSTKIIGFAILGLVAIVVVNLLFYRELKKTFKERKLIWFSYQLWTWYLRNRLDRNEILSKEIYRTFVN